MKRRMVMKRVSVVCFMLLAASLCMFGKHADAQESGLRITPNEYDMRVIPDKYNTGAKGELTPVGLGEKIGDIVIKPGKSNTVNVIEFKYNNQDISGTVTFENFDFSAYPIELLHSQDVAREIRLIFINCKFSSVSVGKQDGLVKCEFRNCTFYSFYGSNAVFEKCSFGGWYSDGLVPFCNIEVNDCLFSDMSGMLATGKEVHTDGTQIYGHQGMDIKNVEYDNCRFEIPAIPVEKSTAYVNACIMLQMEFSNARGIAFRDCIVNGGGYSVYAWSKNSEFVLENVLFQNVRFGCANRYGKFYYRQSQDVVLDDITETDTLYVGSVWKQNGETHFSVTNDTNQERIFLVYTDKGYYEVEIAACPRGTEMTSDMLYDEMPFDLDIVIPVDCAYAVCFDGTTKGHAEQIRFLNWSEQEVVLDKTDTDRLFAVTEETVVSGSCGKNVSYRLTNIGVLYLEGTGATYNYSYTMPAPWTKYTSQIKEVFVGEGIEGLGKHLFKAESAVVAVNLPSTLKTIGCYTFGGCSCLLELYLPATVEIIDATAFPISIQRIYYNGTNWEKIRSTIGGAAWGCKVIFTEKPYGEEIIFQEGVPLSGGIEAPEVNKIVSDGQTILSKICLCIAILLLGGCAIVFCVMRKKSDNHTR